MHSQAPAPNSCCLLALVSLFSVSVFIPTVLLEESSGESQLLAPGFFTAVFPVGA